MVDTKTVKKLVKKSVKKPVKKSVKKTMEKSAGKQPNHNPKTYEQRLTCFKNGFCPYCGAGEATLTATKVTKKNVIRAYRGHCRKCGAENNFTKPESIRKVEL